jgi:hypothetical protein
MQAFVAELADVNDDMARRADGYLKHLAERL